MTQVNGKRDYKHAYKLQKASGETQDQIERQRARRAYDKAGVEPLTKSALWLVPRAGMHFQHEEVNMAWDFMCNVDRVEIDVVNKRAYLHLPKDNVPDGHSTVANISGADPEVEVICLLCAGIPQGFYIKGTTKWEYRGYMT